MSPNHEERWSELKEKLSAIEHERWSDWQKYMHSKCVRVIDVNDTTGEENLREVSMPVDLFKAWERQVKTPYSELSEKEKQSDRDQVTRYWPLIELVISHTRQEVVEEVKSLKNCKFLFAKNAGSNRNAKFKTEGYHVALKEVLKLPSLSPSEDK